MMGTTSMTTRDLQHSPGVPSRRRTAATTGAMALVLLCAGTAPAFAADTTAPAAVRGMVTSADKSRVKLDWTNSPEKDLAGYLVYRATTPDGPYTRLTATPRTGSDYPDTAAPIGVRSYYRVTAVDKSGNESAPVAVSNVRQDGIAPAAPTTLTGTRTDAGITLDWADNTEPDLAGYLVTRATKSGGTYTKLTAAAITGSSFVDTTAAADASYYYRVTAVDLGGFASKVSSIAVLVPDTTAPAAVTAMKTTVSTSSVKLDWASNRESDLAGYHVYRATSLDGTYTRLTAAPRTSSDLTDSTAPAGVPSYYRVVAVDKAGNESVAVAVTATRKDGTAPAAPRSLVATGSATGIALDWADNTEADLAGYVVTRATTSGGTYTVLTTTPLTASEFVDTTAPAGATLYYRVAARDLSGNTSPTAGAGAARVDTTAPGVARDVTAAAGDGSVSLSWTAPADTDLAGYHVYRSVAGAAPVTISTTVVTGTSFTDRTPTNGTPYQYTVVAVDQAGNAASPSAPVSATPTDTTAPAAVRSLTADGTAQGVVLTWAANTEADLAGYVVERADSAAGPYVRLTGAPLTSSGYTDTTAAAGVTSHYRVVAVDRVGNESGASTADASPLDVTPPAQPAGLAAGAAGDAVTLDWTPNTEADLAGYLVLRSTAPDSSYQPLTTTPVGAATFTDTTAPAGATSYYRVVAVDRAGNQSVAATTHASLLVEKALVAGADATVAQDGSGDYTTVAAAVAAAPAGAASHVIGIKPGTYRELLTVDKPNVTLLGATGDASDVVITYDNAAGTPKPDGTGTYGTSGSATVLIRSTNVTTKNLTIENAYQETGTGNEQAVALKTTGDRLVFDNVRLLGDQDTLYVDSPKAGAVARSYFVNSYVEGDVDFVFGRGTAVFDRSTLKAATRGDARNNGYVTAASTDTSLRFGYLITDSTIVSDAPAGTVHLGRPWQPSGDVNAIAQVVIRDTELPAAIKSSPWTDMGTSLWRNARLFEYRNTGPGAAVTADRPQLDDVDAATLTKFTYLAGADGWNPTGQTPPADTTAPAAPAGLSADAGDSSVALTWTAGTESDLAGYLVYRSAGGTATATAADRLTATPVTTPAWTDRTAANGTAYTYVVTAVDKAGNQSVASVSVAGTPVGVPLPAHDILVAADGSGQYTSVQAAITAAKAGTAARPTVIAIKPGVYKELVSLDKSWVTLVGTTGNARDVVLTYDNAAGTTNPATGSTYGTGASQSVLVKGSNVTVKHLTIENSFDEAAFTYSAEQAVALKTTGDRLVFDDVRLLGNQDTLLVDSPDAPVVARSYFVNSYIEGDVDFIFGRGTAVFDRTTIHALTRGSSSNNGYITAASTSDKNPYGFLVVDSTITSNAPAGTYSLGRPWRGWSDGYTKNGVVYNSRGQTTIRNTSLPAAVRTTQPWADMSPNLWTDGRFAEYQNTGAGATVTANRPQLTDEQAAGATAQAYLAGQDGWNPTGS
jgi:pectin methylesterase-like acyl-CoA thioesterase